MKLSKEERKRLIDEPGMSWKVWARFVLLKYWYVFFAFLIDIGVPIQYVENYELTNTTLAYYEMLASLAIVPVFIYIEYKIFTFLFPKEKDTIR